MPSSTVGPSEQMGPRFLIYMIRTIYVHGVCRIGCVLYGTALAHMFSWWDLYGIVLDQDLTFLTAIVGSGSSRS